MARRADTARGVWPFLAVVGALALLGTTASAWSTEQVVRDVGGVAVTETRSTTGVEVVPSSIVVSLVGLLAGLGLLATRGRARRIVALLVALCGVGALFVTGAGLVAATQLRAGTTVAPWLASVAAAAMLVAGIGGARGPGQRLPARYDVDARPDDDEWQIAVDDVDGRIAVGDVDGGRTTVGDVDPQRAVDGRRSRR